jgi:hypothetical protein
MFSMFSSLGEWDQEKGMFDISVFNKQRIKAAAEAMGLNYGEVINTVQAQARRNVVMEQIKGLGFDENTTELVANTAQIDRETGRAYVNYNGSKIFADEINKHKDKDFIINNLETQANSSDENLRDIAQNTLGAKEMAEAANKEWLLDRADFYETIGMTKDRMAKMEEALIYAKYGFDRISTLLNTITGILTIISIKNSFGGFAGGTGVGVPAAGGQAAGAATRSLTSRIGTGMAIGGTLALGGYAASSLMGVQAQKLAAEGNFEDARSVSKWGSAVGYGTAAAGTALGLFSWAGPWAAIPAALALIGGGVYGYMTGGKDVDAMEEQKKAEEAARKEEEERKKEYNYITRDSNIPINDIYSLEELKDIRRGLNGMSTATYWKIKEDTPGALADIPVTEFGGGGYAVGETHANGGVPAELENMEAVIPSSVVKDNKPAVDAMIDGRVESMEVVDVKDIIKNKYNAGVNKIKHVFKPLDMRVGGMIQLNINGLTTNILAQELMKNQGFIKDITTKVLKESAIYTNYGAYKKGQYNWDMI